MSDAPAHFTEESLHVALKEQPEHVRLMAEAGANAIDDILRKMRSFGDDAGRGGGWIALSLSLQRVALETLAMEARMLSAAKAAKEESERTGLPFDLNEVLTAAVGQHDYGLLRLRGSVLALAALTDMIEEMHSGSGGADHSGGSVGDSSDQMRQWAKSWLERAEGGEES